MRVRLLLCLGLLPLVVRPGATLAADTVPPGTGDLAAVGHCLALTERGVLDSLQRGHSTDVNPAKLRPYFRGLHMFACVVGPQSDDVSGSASVVGAFLTRRGEVAIRIQSAWVGPDTRCVIVQARRALSFCVRQ